MKPAKSLKITDIRCGSGTESKLGDVVHLSCKCIFRGGDSLFSSEDDAPYQIRLGARDAFVGIEQGGMGMKVRGLRKVKVPPNLTYHERAMYPELSERAVLYYEIELLKIVATWDNTLHIRCSPIYSHATKELEKRFRALIPTTESTSEFQILAAKMYSQAESEYRAFEKTKREKEGNSKHG